MIRNRSWILTIHKARVLRKKPLEKTFLDFKKWVKSIKTAGCNGARTIFKLMIQPNTKASQTLEVNLHTKINKVRLWVVHTYIWYISLYATLNSVMIWQLNNHHNHLAWYMKQAIAISAIQTTKEGGMQSCLALPPFSTLKQSQNSVP